MKTRNHGQPAPQVLVRGDSSPPLVPKSVPPAPPRSKPGLRRLALLAWATAAGLGMLLLERYANAPGQTSATPSAWPADSSLILAAHRPNLVVFAHPLCPCTRATLAELQSALGSLERPVSVRVAFFSPSHHPADWRAGDLRDFAASIPGVEVIDDREGQEAARFGAATSGSTMLYDGDGRLLFSGGITSARGHEGDNAGAASLRRCLVDGKPQVDSTPVFGCSLRPASVSLNGARNP